jgi:hypothetical protein
MGVTKPYEFIRFGAMEVTKPYKFIGFGAMEVTKPNGSGRAPGDLGFPGTRVALDSGAQGPYRGYRRSSVNAQSGP